MLNLTIVDAQLERSTLMFGNMSPYVTVSHNKQKMQTKTANNQGKKPAFNNSFQLNIKKTSEMVFLRVWHQGALSSDPIGFCQLPASSMMINCGIEEYFNIWYGNSIAGKIGLKTQFTPEGSEQYEDAKKQLEE